MPRRWYWIYRFWTWTTRVWILALGKLPSLSSCGLTCKVRDGWYICIGLLEGLGKFIYVQRLPRWLSGKEPSCQCRSHGFDPWGGQIPWKRKWQPTPVLLPGKSPWTEKPGRPVTGIAKSQTGLANSAQHNNTHVKALTLSLMFSEWSISSVQSLSCVQLFATPWTAACQPSLSITNSQSPPKPMSIESVMPFNHLILCCLLPLLHSIFPALGSFQMSQLFASGVKRIGVSASASVLPMNTQDWSPLGWTGWISLQSKGLSRVFSKTTVQKYQSFCAQLSL